MMRTLCSRRRRLLAGQARGARLCRAAALAAVALAIGAAGGPSAVHAADVNNGQRIYKQYCAQCHGASGVAVLPNAPSFARGERLMQPDPVLAVSIRNGRSVMPAFAGLLNEREIFDVISYLRSIR